MLSRDLPCRKNFIAHNGNRTVPIAAAVDLGVPARALAISLSRESVATTSWTVALLLADPARDAVGMFGKL